MLIEFSVGNFCSFKEPVTLSMLATKLKSRDRVLDQNNTISLSDDLSLLTSAAVYGANASGKSNLVDAMAFMRQFVRQSSKESQADEPIHVSTFRLSTETQNKPAFFQVVFLIDDIQYRYGFEVNQKEVVSEWLFYSPKPKETRLFTRDAEKFNLGRDFKEGRNLEDKTRPNALFLSVAAQFNGGISTKVLGWFKRMGVISGLDDRGYSNYTIEQVVEGEYRDEILNLVKQLDLSIDGFITENIKLDKDNVMFSSDNMTIIDEVPDAVKEFFLSNMGDESVRIKTVHKRWDERGNLVGEELFDLAGQESEGTQKLFYLAGPIVDTLTSGRIIIIDEMEARLHPLITRALIQLFNSLKSNPRRAQLIFTTHDTNLLSNKLFRRDQIWFIEKDRFSASHLYSLAELKVRNDASFEEDYIQGRYGAIPFLGDLQQIVECDDGA